MSRLFLLHQVKSDRPVDSSAKQRSWRSILPDPASENDDEILIRFWLVMGDGNHGNQCPDQHTLEVQIEHGTQIQDQVDEELKAFGNIDRGSGRKPEQDQKSSGHQNREKDAQNID